MPVLSDTVYAWSKWLVQIFLPATASAYFALGNLFGWANTEVVVGVLAIIATFLGTILGISTRQYNKNMATGEVVVRHDPGGVQQASIELVGDPETALMENQTLRLNIRKEDVG